MFKRYLEYRRRARIRVVEIKLARAEGKYDSFTAIFKEQKRFCNSERDQLISLRANRDGLRKELEFLKGQSKEKLNHGGSPKEQLAV